MPEVQAINELANTLQNSILATMAIICLAVIFMMIWQMRMAGAQDKRQQQTLNSMLDMNKQALENNHKAMDNKQQLDRLADGTETVVKILENNQSPLAAIPLLVKNSQDLATQVNELLTGENGVHELHSKVNTMTENDRTILGELQRLNTNLEALTLELKASNENQKRLVEVVTGLAEETRQTLARITQEHPVIAPEQSPSEKETE